MAKSKIKPVKIFLEFLSFSSDRAVFFNLIGILLFLAVLPTEKLSNLPSFCIFSFFLKIIFAGNCPSSGIFAVCHCPFCGLTRALSYFLHGNLNKAIEMNLLFLPVFFVMIVLIGNSIYKIAKNR